MTNRVKPAIDPNLLPEEERGTFLQQLGEDFQQVDLDDEKATGREFFQNKVFDAMRYWSQFIHYTLELDDGSKLKIHRVPATKGQLHEIERLSANVLSKYETVKGKKRFFDPMELLAKQDQLEKLKVDTYIRLDDTGKPPTMGQIYKVADSTEIDGILEACHAISESKWHQGKK